MKQSKWTFPSTVKEQSERCISRYCAASSWNATGFVPYCQDCGHTDDENCVCTECEEEARAEGNRREREGK